MPQTIDSQQSIAAKLLPSEWLKLMGAIMGGVFMVAATMYTFKADIHEASGKAEEALRLAQKAGEDMQAVRVQVDGALVNISSRLGRIEGLLENINQRGPK